MGSLAGRWFSEDDLSLVASINDELLDDMIQTEITIFKICPTETKINIYGETSPSSGKVYFPGIDLTCHIARDEIDSNIDADYGPDRNQNSQFRFREDSLIAINLYPEIDDLILFNSKYYAIDNVVREQLVGGIADKSLSIIVHGHYTRLSEISLTNRQI